MDLTPGYILKSSFSRPSLLYAALLAPPPVLRPGRLKRRGKRGGRRTRAPPLCASYARYRNVATTRRHFGNRATLVGSVRWCSSAVKANSFFSFFLYPIFSFFFSLILPFTSNPLPYHSILVFVNTGTFLFPPPQKSVSFPLSAFKKIIIS